MDAQHGTRRQPSREPGDLHRPRRHTTGLDRHCPPQPDALCRGQVGWSGDGCTSIGQAFGGRSSEPPAPGAEWFAHADLSAASA